MENEKIITKLSVVVFGVRGFSPPFQNEKCYCMVLSGETRFQTTSQPLAECVTWDANFQFDQAQLDHNDLVVHFICMTSSGKNLGGVVISVKDRVFVPASSTIAPRQSEVITWKKWYPLQQGDSREIEIEFFAHTKLGSNNSVSKLKEKKRKIKLPTSPGGHTNDGKELTKKKKSMGHLKKGKTPEERREEEMKRTASSPEVKKPKNIRSVPIETSPIAPVHPKLKSRGKSEIQLKAPLKLKDIPKKEDKKSGRKSPKSGSRKERHTKDPEETSKSISAREKRESEKKERESKERESKASNTQSNQEKYVPGSLPVGGVDAKAKKRRKSTPSKSPEINQQTLAITPKVSLRKSMENSVVAPLTDGRLEYTRNESENLRKYINTPLTERRRMPSRNELENIRKSMETPLVDRIREPLRNDSENWVTLKRRQSIMRLVKLFDDKLGEKSVESASRRVTEGLEINSSTVRNLIYKIKDEQSKREQLEKELQHEKELREYYQKELQITKHENQRDYQELWLEKKLDLEKDFIEKKLLLEREFQEKKYSLEKHFQDKLLESLHQFEELKNNFWKEFYSKQNGSM